MVFIIDTENVANEWINKIHEYGIEKEGVKIIVAYTDKSSKLTYEQLSYLLNASVKADIRFTKCKNGKPNALDFHILGTLSKMLLENNDEKYIIVSNDSGFDDFISVVSSSGANVSRIGITNTIVSEDNIAKDSMNKEVQNTTKKQLSEKELHALQRKFLIEHCEVASTLAESVRNWLTHGIDNTSEKIKKSTSKAFLDKTELKEVLINNLKKYHEEYKSIGSSTIINNNVVNDNTKASTKEINKRKRAFLQNRCGVPSTITELIRTYLEKGINDAITTIKDSKAKLLKNDTKLKQKIIGNIEKNYNDYLKIV